MRSMLLLMLAALLGACSSVSMPKVSMPKMPSLKSAEEKPKDLSATPRDLGR